MVGSMLHSVAVRVSGTTELMSAAQVTQQIMKYQLAIVGRREVDVCNEPE
ncbi:hypothetical protein C8Q80DRAFT_1276346 [Daedaleopsis nitida]|nr:hypothetical protein C8Q80DRAFT_1276346 [Daedaleopsis nitida]